VGVVAEGPRGRRRTRRALLGVVAVAATLLQLTTATSAGAVPPPPPNPSNSQVKAAQRQAEAKAGAVGKITSQLSSAQAALQALSDQVELKQENANKALVDLQTARDAATSAQGDANAARISADAAGKAITQLRKKVDAFAAGSYEQGSELGSIAAYLGAKSPKDLLERQTLLNEISTSELNVLKQMREAQVQQANADSSARAALIVAKRKQAAATAAKHTADDAVAAAQSAAASEAAQAHQLEATQTGLENQLSAAQANVAGLKAQQRQYASWLAQKRAAEAAAAAAARAAAAAARSTHSARSSGGHRSVSLVAGGSVTTVIHRALSAVGIIYAWGGGNAHGPTLGIHDGGVADEFGDFDKVGFDCSGLMVYAFAGAGVSLPHFSGYQYQTGTHVPLSRIQPGDMLFYSSNGRASGIHHVTLYLGHGQMVEAYESGMPVRVTSVRYYNGIMPFAARVL
jgi:cell wall-associated NlpC family hydrolase